MHELAIIVGLLGGIWWFLWIIASDISAIRNHIEKNEKP